jgi:hypothetical protein
MKENTKLTEAQYLCVKRLREKGLKWNDISDRLSIPVLKLKELQKTYFK